MSCVVKLSREQSPEFSRVLFHMKNPNRDQRIVKASLVLRGSKLEDKHTKVNNLSIVDRNCHVNRKGYLTDVEYSTFCRAMKKTDAAAKLHIHGDPVSVIVSYR